MSEPGIRNVFIVSMGDLFGAWVPVEWLEAVLEATRRAPEWNYLFLTKNPEGYIGRSWPDNHWIGTTVDGQARVERAERAFGEVDAKVKFLSCEPLSGRLTFKNIGVFDWVIIGGFGASTPKDCEIEIEPEWVEHLEDQARTAGCKVYCKPNLKGKAIPKRWSSRPKEYPESQKGQQSLF